MPPTVAQRRAFVARVTDIKQRLHVEPQRTGPHALDGRTRAALARVAVRRALEQLGYLSVQRSRISPPNKA
jgi:hypothetical protein